MEYFPFDNNDHTTRSLWSQLKQTLSNSVMLKISHITYFCVWLSIAAPVGKQIEIMNVLIV